MALLIDTIILHASKQRNSSKQHSIPSPESYRKILINVRINLVGIESFCSAFSFFLSYTSFVTKSADEAENSHNNVKIINIAANKSTSIGR